jgi:hypothetical protein
LRRCKRKDANKREPKTWKGWNEKWRNAYLSRTEIRLTRVTIVC